MIISIFSAVDLLHCPCPDSLCFSLYVSSVRSPSPAAAGLMLVLRLSIDKDIDRYQRSENMRLLPPRIFMFFIDF